MRSQENKMPLAGGEVLRAAASSAFTAMSLAVLMNAVVVLIHHCFHSKN
jgi:hypothetical protein